MLMHSNRVIIFPCLQKRAQCTFCMQEVETRNKDEGERITQNGCVLVAGLTVACGGVVVVFSFSSFSLCRGISLCFSSSSSVCSSLFFFLFFVFSLFLVFHLSLFSFVFFFVFLLSVLLCFSPLCLCSSPLFFLFICLLFFSPFLPYFSILSSLCFRSFFSILKSPPPVMFSSLYTFPLFFFFSTPLILSLPWYL